MRKTRWYSILNSTQLHFNSDAMFKVLILKQFQPNVIQKNKSWKCGDDEQVMIL